MNICKNKSKISTIALILLLTISATLVALPAVIAQPPPAAPQTKATVAYLGCMPNPIGVGQEVLMHIGITESLGSADEGWEGMTVNVVKPDGTTETLGPYRTDSTGGTGGLFIPTMAGTYTLTANFPEQTVTMTPFFSPFPVTTVYTESDSDPVELVVLADPIDFYPGHSLPSEYWSRPIDSQLRE